MKAPQGLLLVNNSGLLSRQLVSNDVAGLDVGLWPHMLTMVSTTEYCWIAPWVEMFDDAWGGVLGDVARCYSDRAAHRAVICLQNRYFGEAGSGLHWVRYLGAVADRPALLQDAGHPIVQPAVLLPADGKLATHVHAYSSL